MRVLFVGQGPGKHHPEGARPLEGKKGAGARLANLCGMTNEEFIERFDTVNLLPDWHGKKGKGDRFPLDQAVPATMPIRLTFWRYNRIVFLGSNVAKAFGLGHKPILKWFDFGSNPALIIPHPSGINRWYNDPKNRKKAEKFLRKLVNDLPLQS